VPGSSGGGAAKRVKKEEADAVVKTEPGVDPNEPVDLTALSSDDDDDDETLADLVKPRRRGSRAAGDGRRYPPTIAFDDPFSPRAMPVRCPPNWHTVDGANAAAERLSNEIRLLGVATLTLASPPGEPRVRDTLESLASPGIRATRRTVRKNYRGPAGCETWNDVGEPGAPSGVSVPISRLAECAGAGIVHVAEPHGLNLLYALFQGQHPVTSPWKVPLTRCVVLLDAVVDAPKREEEGGKATGAKDSVVVELAVYASRLMFEMIADDHLKLIMSHLTPAAPVAHAIAEEPRRQKRFYVDQHEAGHASTHDAGFCFTLPGLLAAAVNEGYDDCGDVPNMRLPLMDFQRQTVAWMRDKEASPRGLNGVFWEERRWAERRRWDQMTGEVTGTSRWRAS
jgi:E3 ubiquitin-protein ligase SHPRH